MRIMVVRSSLMSSKTKDISPLRSEQRSSSALFGVNPSPVFGGSVGVVQDRHQESNAADEYEVVHNAINPSLGHGPQHFRHFSETELHIAQLSTRSAPEYARAELGYYVAARNRGKMAPSTRAVFQTLVVERVASFSVRCF